MVKLEKAFYHDGFQLGMKASSPGMTNEKLFSVLAEMYAAIDALTDSLHEFARQQNQSIACKKGCEWCCYQPVFAMDYELSYLKNYIENKLDPEDQTQIKKRATQKDEKLKPLKGDALLNAKHPCPLLKDGACMAYQARPMACRIYLSSSVETCLQFFKVPDDKSNYPALLDFPMRAGRILNEGFRAALKANNINVEEFRIEEKLV